MVVLTHQTENVGAHLSFESTVAWATALRGHKAFRSISTEPAEQPIYLAATYAEQHYGIFDPQLAALEPPQRVISCKLAMAHSQHRHKRVLPQCRKTCQSDHETPQV
jgi:hypothetical protein